jgi:hypothetical protein
MAYSNSLQKPSVPHNFSSLRSRLLEIIIMEDLKYEMSYGDHAYPKTLKKT